MTRNSLCAFVFIAAFSAAAQGASPNVKIKKCQDAQGKWHYGDNVEEFCAKSKITVINDRGLKLKEIEAPLTGEQLKARQQQRVEAEEEARRDKEQQQRDQQLMATYTSEGDIVQMRDRRLADLDAQIRASEETLRTLRATLERMEKQQADAKNIENTRAQIARHETALAEKRREREAVVARFEDDARRYRALTGKKPQ